MSQKAAILKVALLCLVVGLTVTFFQPGKRALLAQTALDSEPSSTDSGQATAQEFPVPQKPLSKTITPCRACHGPEKDFPVNFKRREDLLIHKNLKLNHGGARVWCLDCHHPTDRDYLLPLSDGKPIPFGQSYLLCGKCHGTKYRDWRNGIHGRRTGSWNGQKTYYLCVNCHDPHTPRFKPLEPLPPPQKPWTPREEQVRH